MSNCVFFLPEKESTLKGKNLLPRVDPFEKRLGGQEREQETSNRFTPLKEVTKEVSRKWRHLSLRYFSYFSQKEIICMRRQNLYSGKIRKII